MQVFGIIIICLSAFAIIYSVWTEGFDNPSTALLAKTSVSDDPYSETWTNDSFYIWEPWHSKVSRYYMSLEKLPAEQFLDHNIMAGDWPYGQKYFEENLNQAGVSNPVDALVNRENTYYIAEECGLLLNYLQYYYGPNLKAVEIDKLAGMPVWKIILE